MEKIFINIASFRDPTLVDTIKEALTKSKYPDRLIFGVGLQYYEDEVPDLSFIPKDQLKIINYDVDTRPGLVKIRYEISQLVTDEDYFLMIDSHTMFGPYWDEKIIEEHKFLSEKLKTNCFAFSYAENVLNEDPQFHVETKYSFFDTEKEIKSLYDVFDFFTSFSYSFVSIKDPEVSTTRYKPLTGVTCASFFVPIKFLKEVGLDKHSSFLLEEPYLFWRLHTSGWKAYIPKQTWISSDPTKYALYLKKARNNDQTDKKFYQGAWEPDSLYDNISIKISMLTNLPGKFSIENAKGDPFSFLNEKSMLNNLKYHKRLPDYIFQINSMVNKDRLHPINDKLIDTYILLKQINDTVSF